MRPNSKTKTVSFCSVSEAALGSCWASFAISERNLPVLWCFAGAPTAYCLCPAMTRQQRQTMQQGQRKQWRKPRLEDTQGSRGSGGNGGSCSGSDHEARQGWETRQQRQWKEGGEGAAIREQRQGPGQRAAKAGSFRPPKVDRQGPRRDRRVGDKTERQTRQHRERGSDHDRGQGLETRQQGEERRQQGKRSQGSDHEGRQGRVEGQRKQQSWRETRMGDKAADAICATNNSNKKQKQLGPICRSNAVALKSKTCLDQQSVLDAAWSDNLGTLRLRPSQGICAFSHGGVFSELVPLLPPKSLTLKHILHVITIESLCLKHLDIHGSIYSISWCGNFSKQESVHQSSLHFALADVHTAELEFPHWMQNFRPQPMSTTFHSRFIKGYWAGHLEAAWKSSVWALEFNTMHSSTKKKGLKPRVPLQFRWRSCKCSIASADVLYTVIRWFVSSTPETLGSILYIAVGDPYIYHQSYIKADAESSTLHVPLRCAITWPLMKVYLLRPLRYKPHHRIFISPRLNWMRCLTCPPWGAAGTLPEPGQSTSCFRSQIERI